MCVSMDVSATRATLDPMSTPAADPYADAVWADDEPPPDEFWTPPADDGWAPPPDDEWMPPTTAPASAPPAVPQATPARYATSGEALHTVFGYESSAAIRPPRSTMSSAARRGRAQPSGGGKSRSTSSPRSSDRAPGSLSPLIALMHDQVDALVANGVRAAYLTRRRPPQRAAVERAYLSGELDRSTSRPSGSPAHPPARCCSAARCA